MSVNVHYTHILRNTDTAVAQIVDSLHEQLTVDQQLEVTDKADTSRLVLTMNIGNQRYR